MDTQGCIHVKSMLLVVVIAIDDEAIELIKQLAWQIASSERSPIINESR